jgi:uncharacterized paraquat-inducible protein A
MAKLPLANKSTRRGTYHGLVHNDKRFTLLGNEPSSKRPRTWYERECPSCRYVERSDAPRCPRCRQEYPRC